MADIKKQVLELFEQGKDIIDIKQELEIPIWKISKILEEPEDSPYDEEEIKILDLYNEGNEVFEIKEKLNLPLWKIYKVIEKTNSNETNSGSIINSADGLEFTEGGLSNEALKELLGEEKYQEDILSKFLDIFDENEKNEVIKNASDIIAKCHDCGFSKSVDKATASLTIYKPSILKYLGLLNKRMICTICDSHRLNFIRKSDNLLILSPENEVKCSVCSQSIILPRLKVQPDTNICNLCASNEDIPNPFPKNPLDKCPYCSNNVTQVFDNDGQLKIYCENFRGTKIKSNETCTWTGFYDEFVINNIHDKEYFTIIKNFRSEVSKKEDVPLFYILTNQAIEEIVQHTPSNPREMLEKCPSVPRTFVDKYAKEFFIVLRKLSKKKKEI